MAPPLRRLALDDPEWRRFVDGHPDATPFHHPAWAAMLAESYDMPAFALVMEDAGVIRAGLPVVEVARLRRRRWVSLPYTDRCAPLITRSTDESAFIAALEATARAARVDAVEVRSPAPHAHLVDAGFTHLLPLDGDPEAVLSRCRSNVRRNIRKAERMGVTVRTGDRAGDLTDVFYRLHVSTRRRQGVPVQPRRFFDLFWRRLAEPGIATVLLAYAHGSPLAGVVLLRANGLAVYKFGASDLARQECRANNLVMWHAISAACLAGDHAFDFGRTDHGAEGLRGYKRSWGAEERPLVYGSFADTVPQATSGRAQAVLGAALRRSPPVVTRLAGELLYRFAA